MSNLLEQASLVMIPSGYKEDVVYSEIPLDGSGDLQLTRASNGTRINSAGLVEVVPWNFIQQSEAIGVVSPWTNSNLTITANSVIAPNGTTTADVLTETTATTTQFRTQQTTPQSTNIYTLSVYVKNITGTRQAYIDLGPVTGFFNFANETIYSASAIGSFEKLANGWYRIALTTANAITPSTIYMGLGQSNSETYTGNGTSAIAFWGAQLNIGSIAKPYFPTTDRLNVPRLTYQNGGGGCPSLLLEKQSTNLVLRSEEFDNASWTKAAVSVTANNITSPDGTQNADLLTTTSASICGAYQLISTGSGTFSFCIFAKKGNNNYLALNAQTSSADNCTAIFDLSDGTLGEYQTKGTTAYVSHKIENFGNDWYRCTMVLTATSNAYFFPMFAPLKTGNTFNASGEVSVASGKTLYLWGCQVEASSYPTSYIPTTSSSATRVADECKKSGIGALIGGTSGTVFFDIKTNPTLSSSNYKQFCYYVTSGGSQSYLYLDGANKITTNATWGSLFYNTALQPNTRYKVALVFAPNDFALYINGVSVVTASSGTPNNNVDLQIGQFNGTEMCEFVFNQYTHFPSRLTNAELASLTTI